MPHLKYIHSCHPCLYLFYDPLTPSSSYSLSFSDFLILCLRKSIRQSVRPSKILKSCFLTTSSKRGSDTVSHQLFSQGFYVLFLLRLYVLKIYPFLCLRQTDRQSESQQPSEVRDGQHSSQIVSYSQISVFFSAASHQLGSETVSLPTVSLSTLYFLL